MRSRTHSLPSGRPTKASSRIRPDGSSILAWTPSGLLQVAPSSETTVRSAVSSRSAGPSVIGSTTPRAASSPSRICRTSEPWPAAGVIDSPASAKEISSCRPSRRSPATASTIASTSPSPSLRRRVSTLPCSSLTSRSGRAASSCARRRRLAVPTRAPSGTSSRLAPTPIQASAASSRGGTAASIRPSVSSAGTSFAEWTPTSASPSSSARSTPRTNRALSPGSPSEETSTSSAPPNISATCLVWRGRGHSPAVAIRSDPGRGEASCTFSPLAIVGSHQARLEKVKRNPCRDRCRCRNSVTCPRSRPRARSRRRARTARAAR